MGKKWGNALGGYKTQRRVGGKFASGGGGGKSKGSVKKYSKKRGSYARKLDKMSQSKSRTKRAVAYASRGGGGASSSVAYKISKKRGQKAGKTKTYSKKRGGYARKADSMAASKSRTKRVIAATTRGNGTNKGLMRSSAAYQVSKKRGAKAGQAKRKRTSPSIKKKNTTASKKKRTAGQRLARSKFGRASRKYNNSKMGRKVGSVGVKAAQKAKRKRR